MNQRASDPPVADAAEPRVLQPPAPARLEPRAAEAPARRASRWRVNLALFLLTWISVFLVGAGLDLPALILLLSGGVEGEAITVATIARQGWSFAVPLMAILLTHELGHYFAARLHGVPASLPFFIPLPLQPFGTMGAVISMPERIRSRNALLDIGAAGPLAGMLVAIPVLVIGLQHSEVRELAGGGLMEGQCLLYLGLKRAVLGPIPAGHDVYLSATAFAGWTGLFITMLNLLPVLQLDGGHISYALFDRRFALLSRGVHGLLLAAFAYNYLVYGSSEPGLVWVVWFTLLMVLRRLGGGLEHPPTDPGRLTAGRRGIAVLCLVLFALLFMPTPLRQLPLIAEAHLSAALG